MDWEEMIQKRFQELKGVKIFPFLVHVKVKKNQMTFTIIF